MKSHFDGLACQSLEFVALWGLLQFIHAAKDVFLPRLLLFLL
jgi:hypothetical protein